MTIQEFHINFNLELDKTLDFEYPYMLPEQIDYWLNKAQDRFIKDRAFPQDPRKKGFEVSQKRIDDLRNIVVPSGAITPTLVDNAYYIELPEDYRYLVRHRCITDDGDCGQRQVGGLPVQEDDINQLLKDPFWEPIADEPLYYFNGNTIVYETKGNYTLLNTKLTYIKIPNQLRLGEQYQEVTTNVECELSEYTHHEILDIAVSMVLENIESQRYQTNLNELNKTE